jgi:flagellar basal-body rod modification protein FlgD
MSDTSGISNAQQSSLAAAASSSVPTLPATQQLGENDFLNLLVTQLKNQDPLKPVDNQEFVAQLAQFSQLQQSTQQVTLLQQLINAQSASQQYALLPLIGRQVDVTGSLIELGTAPAKLDYTLAGNASAVSITILNGNNQPIRVLSLGAQSAGAQDVQWDGRDQQGVSVAPGTYRYTVSAVDNKGTSVNAVTTSLVTVSGIRPNAGQAPSLLAGDQVVDPSTILAIR